MGDLYRRLQAILQENTALWSVIQGADMLGVEHYYVGAGCIAQTVWNVQNRFPPMYGIADIDFVYYDDTDLSWSGEDAVIRRVGECFGSLGIPLDVKNQARVHLWYRKKWGVEVPPVRSLEEAIGTWPTTATAVGVRLLDGAEWRVCAPFGLNDLFAQVIRANKVRINEAYYREKCTKWHAKWNSLQIVPW